MHLEHSRRSAPITLSRKNACDDTPVSHRHCLNPGLRVILADDHPVVLKGAEIALRTPARQAHSIVATATNADELIDRLERMPCDLIISDYSMPFGDLPDGLALMSYLKRRFSHIPLIVMTMLRKPEPRH